MSNVINNQTPMVRQSFEQELEKILPTELKDSCIYTPKWISETATAIFDDGFINSLFPTEYFQPFKSLAGRFKITIMIGKLI